MAFFFPLGKSFNKGIGLLQQRKQQQKLRQGHILSPLMPVGVCLHLQWEQNFKDIGITHTNRRIKSEPSMVYDTNRLQRMVP